jgi:hypothetical protein
MVGRVAAINERGTLDSSGVNNFVFLDGNIKVSPHEDLRGRVQEGSDMLKSGFLEHVARMIII